MISLDGEGVIAGHRQLCAKSGSQIAPLQNADFCFPASGSKGLLDVRLWLSRPWIDEQIFVCSLVCAEWLYPPERLNISR